MDNDENVARIDDITTDDSEHDRKVPARGRRVCFAIETLDMGGAETHAVRLAEYLLRNDWEVIFAVMAKAGPLADHCRAVEIPVYDEMMPNRRGTSILRRFGKIVSQWQFDTLFVVECFYINALLAYRAAKKSLDLNAFAIVHNWPSRREFTHPAMFRLRLTLMNRIFRRVIFIAEGQKRHYEDTLGIRFARPEVVCSGIDTERFSPKTMETDRTSTTEFDRNPRVAIVASLQPRKGHEDFLKAAAKVLQQRPGVEFLIIGDGPRWAELQRMARDFQISSHVSFLGIRHDLPELLRSIDVVVLPSHDVDGGHVETLPLSLLEAGAAAVPCVATDVGAVSEIVVDGRTGFIVPERDPEAIAERVVGLLDDPARCNEMGMVARERVIAKFNADRMYRRFEELFLTGR